MKICFLINRQMLLAKAENRFYLANAALALGHAPAFAFTDSLACHNGETVAELAMVTEPLVVDQSLEGLGFAQSPMAAFDVVWVLGLGRRETFLDKIQLLKLLAQRIRVINSPDALFFLHSKISQDGLSGAIRYPETHISASFADLWRIYQTGGDWIVKPAGESLGRDVFKLKQGDSNARVILQTMTGHDGARYCLLQRYVPEVADGEKRVLIAGGEVIGQYKKMATIDHRGNLHQEAEATLCNLLPEERTACEGIGRYLLDKGAYYVGLDIAWPWFLEWNVLNPGGIGTTHRLGGENLAKTVINRVLAASG